MEHVNLYESLGVERTDCAVAVRRAYRDLARLSHPVTVSIPAFVQEIELAVAVLSDGSRRASYVRRTLDPAAEAEAAEPDAPMASLDLLGDFQGGPPSVEEVWHAFRRNFAPGAEPKSARVDALDLWIGNALPGAEPDDVLALALPVFHPCSHCHGTGSVDGFACTSCDASGLAEARATARVPIAVPGQHMFPLEWLGIRSPILRLHVTLLT